MIRLGCKRHKHTPHLYCITAAIRFGLCRFRSPLLTVSQLIFFPLATQMFPFAKVHVPQREQEKPRRDSPTKSHSGILGSTDACSYPRHIAACHALLRLPSQAIHHTASARRMVTFRRTLAQFVSMQPIIPTLRAISKSRLNWSAVAFQRTPLSYQRHLL